MTVDLCMVYAHGHFSDLDHDFENMYYIWLDRHLVFPVEKVLASLFACSRECFMEIMDKC